MKLPADVRQLLQRRFDLRRHDWLSGGAWPLDIALGIPSEQQALAQLDATRGWVASWRQWNGPGTLEWTERRWRTLGTQRLPAMLRLEGPAQVAAWLGADEQWERSARRYAQLLQRWPVAAALPARGFDALAGYADVDFERLLAVLDWLAANPASGLYPRQLPVPGIDTKWLESRKPVLAELVAAIGRTANPCQDFYALCGLRRPPSLLRLRILDPALRSQVGGIGDLAVPLDDLERLSIAPQRVLVVENLQTGLAMEALPGTVAFMGLGYGVDLLGRLPWVRDADCVYWGDIDTHGFGILDRARSVLPHARSVLMDEHTLLLHRALWSVEPEQHRAQELSRLTDAECAVYRGLKDHAWGASVRLEQERIAWPIAQRALTDALGS